MTIRTVPALPGIAFLFDGNPLVTNRAGVASVTEQRDSRLHSLGVVPFTLPSGNRRYVGVATGHAIVFSEDVSLSRAATVDLTVISAADVAVTGGPVVIGVLCFLLLSRKRRIWL